MTTQRRRIASSSTHRRPRLRLLIPLPPGSEMLPGSGLLRRRCDAAACSRPLRLRRLTSGLLRRGGRPLLIRPCRRGGLCLPRVVRRGHGGGQRGGLRQRLCLGRSGRWSSWMIGRSMRSWISALPRASPRFVVSSAGWHGATPGASARFCGRLLPRRGSRVLRCSLPSCLPCCSTAAATSGVAAALTAVPSLVASATSSPAAGRGSSLRCAVTRRAGLAVGLPV